MPNWLKNLVLTFLLMVVIAGSFWVSYLIGKQILIPAKPLPVKTDLFKSSPDMSETKESGISIEVETSDSPIKIIEPEDLVSEKTEETKTAPVVKINAPEAPVVTEIKVEEKKAAEVKETAKPAAAVQTKVTTAGQYKVQAGAFRNYNNALNQINLLKNKGFSATYQKVGTLYRVFAGDFNSLANAKKLVASLESSGFQAIIKY